MGVYIPNIEMPKELGDVISITIYDKKDNWLDDIEVYRKDIIEIDLVRCGECVWYKDFDGCFFSTDEVKPDDFCSYAERRTDERY